MSRWRADFPGLDQVINGKELIYLDNAATTQKPEAVLAAVDYAQRIDCSNVHRGVHALSLRATASFEEARRKMARFINASSSEEVIFVRGATEAINLVAHSWGDTNIKRGDKVLVTELDHHSNIVPWQLVCERVGAQVEWVPVLMNGTLDLKVAHEILSSGEVKIFAFGHVSNALGTINPVQEMVAMAHEFGALALVDGAQASPHIAIDVEDLGADFYALSGHKMYGPSGIGVLWGKIEHLAGMPPWQGGGDMIRSVSIEGTTFAEPPFRFEAGTPNVAGAIGLGAASVFIEEAGLSAIAEHEALLVNKATESLAEIKGVRLMGEKSKRVGAVSFVIDGVHPHDVGTLLDQEGIAVRTGHHCAQPLMDRLGIPATVRASFGLYNTLEEIDSLQAGVEKVVGVFA